MTEREKILRTGGGTITNQNMLVKFAIVNWYEEWQKLVEDYSNYPNIPIRVKEYDTKFIPGDRKEIVDLWQNSPAEIRQYKGDEYLDRDGNQHQHSDGYRLYVGEDKHEVMDTCQQPWCEATVFGLFEGFPSSLSRLEGKEPACLLRGFGLGQQAQLILNQLAARGGGELHIIELNFAIFNSMGHFLERNRNLLEPALTSSIYGARPHIKLFIHVGDAYQITAQMAEDKKEFDIIISDTYPLSLNEHSINDLIDIDNQIKCLKSNGRFSFFAYTQNYRPNATGITDTQQNILQPFFDTTIIKPNGARIDDLSQKIGVPSDYEFLQKEDGCPVEFLPVIICTDPRK